MLACKTPCAMHSSNQPSRLLSSKGQGSIHEKEVVGVGILSPLLCTHLAHNEPVVPGYWVILGGCTEGQQGEDSGIFYVNNGTACCLHVGRSNACNAQKARGTEHQTYRF